jgi:hypothetical protein
LSVAVVYQQITESPPQMGLWDEVVLPDEFRTYYRETRLCWACDAPMNHEVHLLNHFRKCHLSSKLHKPKLVSRTQRYFMYDRGRWKRVSLIAFLIAQRAGETRRPVACTKK